MPWPFRRSRVIPDYELKIDEQTNKFIEVRQKLIYFLITGVVVISGFLLNYILGNLGAGRRFVYIAVISLGIAFITAASALANLYLGIESYRHHLSLRHQGKGNKDQTQKDVKRFRQLGKWARRFEAVAFIGFCIQVLLVGLFFILLIVFDP